MTTTKELGDHYEEKAKNFLEQKGYEILEQNYRSGRNEVDLITLFQNTLIFVEVKFRKNSRFGNPEDFVDSKKMAKVMEASEDYIFAINWQKNIRFDVIAITPKELVHFEDVALF